MNIVKIEIFCFRRTHIEFEFYMTATKDPNYIDFTVRLRARSLAAALIAARR